MEVNDLEVMIDNLLDVRKSKEANRKIWVDRTKQIITDCFKEIVNRFKIGLEMGAHDNPNLDDIYLYFLPTYSEFSGIDTDKIKNGGALIFAQTFNGEISIKIQYPSIETIRPSKQSLVIKTLTPYDITKAVVFKMVGEFLKEMAIWESDNE